VSGENFNRTLFPLGHLEKPQVRKIAEQKGFANAKKKDSTGICFIGERRFKDFLERYLPAQPGKLTDETGKVIGEHHGLMYYTLGQRQGLGIGGLAEASEDPWYVAKKELDTNTLVAVQGHHHPLLFSRSLTTGPMQWVAGEAPSLPLRATAKTRYRQADQACTITRLTNNTVTVVFDERQRAVKTGQSVVFYKDDIGLVGAVIEV